ncbi:hypothetical protein N7452_001545 [Penicillium brevicompactum]|uniref:Uncharacterized protein n=1 Tax=Penicillium brevicompactum TaxID=5074 RepID=A0A9W9URX5_PENBR|nr:hypothetical protein N7452_001545 [Penicillium brevicompactum]
MASQMSIALLSMAPVLLERSWSPWIYLLVPGISGAANEADPNGYFKPIWSPDRLWVVFTSDRNTPWRGHSAGAGWEHMKELSIYACRPNGSDFLVSSRTNYTQGSP